MGLPRIPQILTMYLWNLCPQSWLWFKSASFPKKSKFLFLNFFSLKIFLFSFFPIVYLNFFPLPPICFHSLPSALPLNLSERHNNKNTVEWRRSGWQSRRMWSSPPPTEHIKNTSSCGAILTANKLKTVGKTLIQPGLKIHPYGIM